MRRTFVYLALLLITGYMLGSYLLGWLFSRTIDDISYTIARDAGQILTKTLDHFPEASCHFDENGLAEATDYKARG